jgi:hypothetical protein
VSIILTSAAVAGGLALGRWLSTRAARREMAPRVLADTVVEEEAPKSKTPKPDDVIDWERFPCRLGDVIVHPGGDEAWLAGAVVLFEDVAAAVLFVAPEAKSDRAVYVHTKPSTEIFWLSPLAADAWTPPPTSPPTSIEIEGEQFERIRRLPFRAKRVGEGAPDLSEEILVAEYKSLRSLEKRVISISGGGHARAWIGSAIDIGICDVLPSGEKTL